MSNALHPTALHWNGKEGYARHDGVIVSLERSPSPVWASVTYLPGVRADVMDRGAAEDRQLMADEVKQIQSWLKSMAVAARVSVGQSR